MSEARTAGFWAESIQYLHSSGDEAFAGEIAYAMVTLYMHGA